MSYFCQDVIYGYDFAPLLYANEQTGKLEVDLDLVNDVREQRKGIGEDVGRRRRIACIRGSPTLFSLRSILEQVENLDTV